MKKKRILQSMEDGAIQGAPLVIEGMAQEGDIRKADLTVGAGECVVISGRSGCGKSTLLRLAADLSPGVGAAAVGAFRREAAPACQWRRRIVYVASESGWWTTPIKAHMADLAQARVLLAELEMSPDLLLADPAHVSGGERQRLALIRALVIDPWFLLLDEPTSALDQTSVRLVEKMLRRVLRRGVGMLVVSHDERQIARLADRHLILSEAGLREAALVSG